MSRVGKKPIVIPSGVTVTIEGNRLEAKGPKGTLKDAFSREVKMNIKENELTFEKVGKTKNAPALWGTTRALVSNMIQGVASGFEKQLELQGVGYRMNIQGKKLVMALGFSHPIEKEIPQGIEAEIEKNVLKLSGINKQQVGQFAAEVRKLKEVEPYKGKGFRYVGEQIVKKEGKKGVGSE